MEYNANISQKTLLNKRHKYFIILYSNQEVTKRESRFSVAEPPVNINMIIGCNCDQNFTETSECLDKVIWLRFYVAFVSFPLFLSVSEITFHDLTRHVALVAMVM